MKLGSLILALLLAVAGVAFAQTGDFRLQKITKDLMPTPQYNYSGARPSTGGREDWLAVEVTFSATPEFTDELTLKYYILINGKLLTGEVTHSNVPAGREDRSVMYVSPKAIARVMAGRPFSAASVQNVAVQILQAGAVKDELSLIKAQAQWFTTLPAVTGLVLNKNETPFGPLYWDRYEQIKPAAR